MSFLSNPAVLLRAEAACVLFVSMAAYHLLFPHHWVLFACLFLVPDLSLLLYLRGLNAYVSRIYNAVHNYVLPILLGAIGFYAKKFLLGEVSLIWICHIGMDRMIGHGLKYPLSFKNTHLQRVALESA